MTASSESLFRAWTEQFEEGRAQTHATRFSLFCCKLGRIPKTKGEMADVEKSFFAGRQFCDQIVRRLVSEKRALEKRDETIDGYSRQNCDRGDKVERNVLMDVGIILKNSYENGVHDNDANMRVEARANPRSEAGSATR